MECQFDFAPMGLTVFLPSVSIKISPLRGDGTDARAIALLTARIRSDLCRSTRRSDHLPPRRTRRTRRTRRGDGTDAASRQKAQGRFNQRTTLTLALNSADSFARSV